MKKSSTHTYVKSSSFSKGSGKKPSMPRSFLERVLGRDTAWKYSSLMSVAVVLLSILYGRITQTTSINTSLKGLLALSCSKGVCLSDLLKANGNKLLAARRLEKGWKLMEIPRSMQISVLDALRDPFVRNNLHKARHPKTQQPLSRDAFLAAHLAVLVKTEETQQYDRERRIFLKLLPTFDDYHQYHPVTFDLRELTKTFGSHTYNYFLVARRKSEIESEYKGFCHASSEFKELISYKDYIAARLNVRTKALFDGPLNDLDASQEELSLYKKHLGIDIKEGGSTMVLLMDAVDGHHQNPNTAYKYVPESKSFYVYAGVDIAAGQELSKPLEDRSDLYSTFGFVGGDFSERTASLLAVHQIIDRRVVSEKKYESEQKKQLLRYLQYDDGYSSCISDDDIEELEFKRLKGKLLRLILNDFLKWSASLPRRDEDAESSSIPIDDGVNPLVSTCRLLALSHRDYEGKAKIVVQQNIEEIERAQRVSPEDLHGEGYSLVMKRGNTGLEYRAGVWLFRLAEENLNRWGSITSDDELARLRSLVPRSKEWLAVYARHQELLTLETLKLYAEYVINYFNENKDPATSPEDMFYRNDICPVNSPKLRALLEEK